VSGNTESAAEKIWIYWWNESFSGLYCHRYTYSLHDIVFTVRRTAFATQNLVLKWRSDSSQLKIYVRVIMKIADTGKHAPFP